ncbi:PBSX family phage terminase large subunit [Staphylococcus aureus]|uniref:PBSX family phage terminase large subunit n=1 Tax=Staphylococcus aureus TaxID=1280 RepID=UPI000DA84A14|nr:PBSX family phage terminase large subunit [Staphylococcus aureus]PZI73833.1 PBSX family phage terminase large subunit [Staphylococcus aureus]
MINEMLNPKQQEVWNCFINDKPKVLIASGAKRAGKTYVFILLFLMHIATYKDKGLNFIIGGATQASIRRNILDDMELILGRELTLDKSNAVKIFGNKVYVFDGQNSDAWKKARGFTSAGAFLNEGTALHNMFIKEVFSRCSYQGARILIDTNPENPMHPVKKAYIDKSGQRLSNGRLNIKAFQFTLFDNTFLDEEYIESIIASTPTGMFTDRDIYGKWVSAEGVVYKDFKEKVHYITEEEFKTKQIKRKYAGVDWGYEHYGSIMVVAEDFDGNKYVIEEHAHRHKEIDDWVAIAKGVIKRHGDILFYCDTARPEHIERFRREKIKARYADKAVIAGIEVISRLFKLNKIFIIKEKVSLFKEEIYNYVWKDNADEPVKLNDDTLDALRYAVYTANKPSGTGFN